MRRGLCSLGLAVVLSTVTAATAGADPSELTYREPSVAPPAQDTTAPDTTLTGRPKSNTKQRRASFSFIPTEPGSTFLCAIDEEALVSCSSPLTTRKLRRGRHTFEVRAIDSAGNVDPTPATANWKVRRK